MQSNTLPFKKKFLKCFLLALLLPQVYLSAQSTIGITNQPDTSYTTHSAYASSKKSNPEIRVVSEIHSKSVKEKRSIAYCSIGKRQLLLDVFHPSAKANK